jgi:echinoderm microtubule-associated protein-like 5
VLSGKQLLSTHDNLEADTAWNTHSCVLGFNVMGIWPTGSDGTDVNALDVSLTKGLVATGVCVYERQREREGEGERERKRSRCAYVCEISAFVWLYWIFLMSRSVCFNHLYCIAPHILLLLLLMPGDDFGNVSVFNYPCVVAGAPSSVCGGHSSHVMNVKFSAEGEGEREGEGGGGQKLVSVGGNDNSAMTWAVL